MPPFVEPLITDLVEAFAKISDLERAEVLASWKREAEPCIGWYARKLAGRAVRDHSEKDLRNAMVAIAISSCFEDPRELAGCFWLSFRSARHLALDGHKVFRDAAALVPGAGSEALLGFLKREPSLQDIATFGYSEGTGPFGFDYLPLLAEFGGPTPF